MPKIAQIEISDFRGFNGLRTLDLDGTDIVIFLGMNGFGKSSVFDAVEWGLTGHLSRYEPYLLTGRKQDFQQEKKVLRNKYADNPNTFVKIYLDNGKKFGRRVALDDVNSSDYNTGSIVESYSYGLESITRQSIDAAHANHYLSATHVLSQDTINHFITSKKPDERYEALAVNFGTSLYKPFEENVQNLLMKITEKEKGAKGQLDDHLILLKEYEQQISLEEEAVNLAVGSANAILAEIRRITDHFKISKFEFQDEEVRVLGGSTKDIKKFIIRHNEEITTELDKQNTLKVLIRDFKAWQEHNARITQIDKEVAELKDWIVKVDSVERDLHLYKTQDSSLQLELLQEQKNINIAEDISNKIPGFLKARKGVEESQKRISDNNSKLKIKQESQAALKEKQLKHRKTLQELEQRLEKIRVLKSNLEKLQKECSAGTLEELKRNKKELESLISLEKQNIDKFKALEFIADLDLNGFCKEVEQLSYEDFYKEHRSHVERAQKALQKLELVDAEIEKNQTLLKSIKSDLNKKEEEYTRSRAMLAQALIEVSGEDNEESSCPVCDTGHQTNSLISHIETKLNSAEFEAVKGMRRKQEELEKELKEHASSKMNLEQEVISYQPEFIAKIRKILEQHFTKIIELTGETETLIARITSVEAEIEEGLRQSSLVLGVDDKDTGGALFNAGKVESEVLLKKANTEKEFEHINGSQDTIIKEIDSILADNQKASEDIKLFKSDAYQEVEQFFIKHQIRDQSNCDLIVGEYLTNIKQNFSKLERSIEENQKQIRETQEKKDELFSLFERAKVDKKISELSQEAATLNRFISIYRDKCMSADVSLDQLTNKVLEKKLNTKSKELDDKREVHGLLLSLDDVNNTFERFVKEKRARVKASRTKNKIAATKKEIAKINNVKKKIVASKKMFPNVLKAYITQNLDVQLFNKIYKSLNPHRRFKNMELDVDVKRDKVLINFNASHSSIKGRPEFLFSSAQLNTFGVSMFLSMALRQNWLDLDTVLLDDPIQNLDDINVLSLIDLLRSLLDQKNGKQIIMSTHDERFYNLIRRKFSDYSIRSYKFQTYGTPHLDPIV